jgi:DNA-binding CsgD family transcriptional regulator
MHRREDAPLAGVIAAAYDAALGDAAWDEVVRRMCAAVKSHAGGILVFADDRRYGAMAAIHNMSDATLRRYAGHYWTVDLWRINTRRIDHRPCQPFVGEAVCSERELLKSEIYPAIHRPEGIRHMCGGLVLHEGGNDVAFSVWRGPRAGMFSQAELAAMAAVQPHIARAIRLNMRLAEIEARWAALMAAEADAERAVLVFDAEERLLDANASAMALLMRGDRLRLDGTRLGARDPAADRALRARIAAVRHWQEMPSAPPVAALPLVVASGEPPQAMTIRIVPLPRHRFFPAGAGAAYLVIVEPQDGAAREALDHASTRFGLTPAETGLLGALVAGRDLAAAAAELGRRYNTARNQLQSILAKTRTHRQAELVAKVLALRG